MNDKQKIALYWDLYQEITTSYKFINKKQPPTEDKKKTEKVQEIKKTMRNGLLNNEESDDERPISLMVKRKDTQEDLQDIEYPKMEKLSPRQSLKRSRSNSVHTETVENPIEEIVESQNNEDDVTDKIIAQSKQFVPNPLE